MWQLEKKAENSKKKSPKVNTISVYCIMLRDLWIGKNEGNPFSSVSGRFLHGHALNPIMGRRGVAYKTLAILKHLKQIPPRPLPRLNEIVPLVFISVNRLNYLLALCLQVVPIFLY